jgi:hypothetical protein
LEIWNGKPGLSACATRVNCNCMLTSGKISLAPDWRSQRRTYSSTQIDDEV